MAMAQAAATEEVAGIKVHKLSELTADQVQDLRARPRIDFTSIFETVLILPNMKVLHLLCFLHNVQVRSSYSFPMALSSSVAMTLPSGWPYCGEHSNSWRCGCEGVSVYLFHFMLFVSSFWMGIKTVVEA